MPKAGLWGITRLSKTIRKWGYAPPQPDRVALTILGLQAPLQNGTKSADLSCEAEGEEGSLSAKSSREGSSANGGDGEGGSALLLKPGLVLVGHYLESVASGKYRPGFIGLPLL